LKIPRIYGTLSGELEISKVEFDQYTRVLDNGITYMKGVLKTAPNIFIDVLLKVSTYDDAILQLKEEAEYMLEKMSETTGVAHHYGFYALDTDQHYIGCSVVEYGDYLDGAIEEIENKEFRWVTPLTLWCLDILIAISNQLIGLAVSLHQTTSLDLDHILTISIRKKNEQPLLVECVQLLDHKCPYKGNILSTQGDLEPEYYGRNRFPCDLILDFVDLFPDFWSPSASINFIVSYNRSACLSVDIKWYGHTIKCENILSPSFLFELSEENSHITRLSEEERWDESVEMWGNIASRWDKYHPGQSHPPEVELLFKNYNSSTRQMPTTSTRLRTTTSRVQPTSSQNLVWDLLPLLLFFVSGLCLLVKSFL
ncbi:hypothetical protein H0H93_004557, partial [Arthromyces matolae]